MAYGLKGQHKSAQGRATRRQPQSAALGLMNEKLPALLRATQSVTTLPNQSSIPHISFVKFDFMSFEQES